VNVPRQVLPAAGLGAPLVASAALVPVRDWVGPTNAALILMIVVVAVAVTGSRSAALLAALSAAAWFDFFFTQPYLSFAVHGHDDLVLTGVLAAAALIVVQIVLWARRQQSTAERTVSEISAVRSMAEMIVTGEDTDYVLMSASFWLRELLFLKDCRYEAGADLGDLPRIEPDGTVTVGAMRWATERQGLIGPEVCLPVRTASRVAGRFVLVPTAGRPLTPDRLFTAAAIADQVGIAVTGHAEGRGGVAP
jgi:K+-sensing histidine kinase KdpD